MSTTTTPPPPTTTTTTTTTTTVVRSGSVGEDKEYYRHRRPSFPIRVYLFLFNVASLAFWVRVLLVSLPHIITSQSGLWEEVEAPLKLAQTIALLEVVHSFLGLVRSPAVMILVQISSRLHFVWILWPHVAISRIGLLGCCVIWSLAEVIRYLFYALQLWNAVPYVSKWLRYSGFIVLYPLGIGSELVGIWWALGGSLQNDKWLRQFPSPMPNALNFQLDLYYTYVAMLFLYIPGTLHLFGYMLRQRKKALAPLEEMTDDKKEP